MNSYRVTIPELAIVAATRGMAGLGAGLLLSSLVAPNTKKTLGWTLLAIGAASTIPILMALTGKRRSSPRAAQVNAGAPSGGEHSTSGHTDEEIDNGSLREEGADKG